MNNYEYAGMGYGSRRLMCLARRNHYVEMLRAGLSFTQACLPVVRCKPLIVHCGGLCC
jgi:hypothetical protein